MANELETRAAGLRLEALQHMTVALAGVDCRELFTLLTTFFGRGTEFQADPFSYLDGAPKIRPPLDLTDTDEEEEEGASVSQEQSDPTQSSVSIPISTPVVAETSSSSQSSVLVRARDPPVKSRPKGNYPDKVPDILQARGFLPEDKDSLHNTGIPAVYAVRRSGSSDKGRSLYLCPYEDRCGPPPYSGDIASAGSHVRRHHLGHCIQCPYDGNRFYNGAGWRDHMVAKHSKAPWYRSELGIDCDMPEELFRVKSSDPLNQGASVSVSAPSVPDDDVEDTLKHVADAAEEEEEIAFKETDTGIGRYTLKELRKMFENFLPSDLRKYEYFGGGSWMGRRVRAGYPAIVSLFTALASQDTDNLEDLEPEDGEEPLRRKKRKHKMHSYELGPRSHKIWRPDQDPDGGTSTA